MKRLLASLLAAVLCAGALAGCGSSGSSSKADTSKAAAGASSSAGTETDTSTADAGDAETSKSAEAPAASSGVKEVDFMDSFLGGSGKNYLGMNLADLNADTGNGYDEAHATEFDKSFGQATYSLGEVDSILGGRAKFGGKLPVTITLFLDGDRIKKVLYKIEEGSVDSAAVCKSIAEVLKNGLPADYKGEYDYKSGGKDSARFTNDVNGYVFEVKHFSLDDSGYPVHFTLESYKDKYGQ